MTLTALTSTTAPASASVWSDADLKTANTAATQAEDVLKQIAQLQATAQPGDVFTLQKLEALAQTALSQANGILPEGQSSVHAAADHAGYVAQSALQKIAHRLSLGSAPSGEIQHPQALDIVA
jgi:hypothetical protein